MAKYSPGQPLRMMTIDPTGPHTATVVFLHGFGDTGMGWEFMVDAIAPHMPHVKWILPHAPIRPITAFQGQLSHAWYDIVGGKASQKVKEKSEEGMKSMMKQVFELLKSTQPSRLVIGGFSQGCALSSLLALTAPHDIKLSGLMLLSGGLPAPRFLHTDRSSTNENCPVLIAHGTDDDRIGLEGGALRTEKVLKEFGWKDVRMKIYEGLGHSASEDEMRDIFQFLQEVIPEASGASSQSKM